MLNYSYAYLFGNLFLCFPVWLLLFVARKDLRKQMLLVSFLGGLAGPLSELYYLQDYWRPLLFTGWKIGIEDFLFGFFIAGIAAVFYEEVFGKRFAKRKTRKNNFLWLVIPLLALFTITFNGLFFLGLNSIYASIIGFLLIALLMIIFRRDLWFDAVMSGLLVGTFMFVGYLILLLGFPELFQRLWLLKNISGILVFNIPIEELLWGFGWGMVAGPLYEFYAGLKFKKSKSS